MLLSECSQLNSTTNVPFKTEQAINLLNNTVAKEVIQNKPLKIAYENHCAARKKKIKVFYLLHTDNN